MKRKRKFIPTTDPNLEIQELAGDCLNLNIGRFLEEVRSNIHAEADRQWSIGQTARARCLWVVAKKIAEAIDAERACPPRGENGE